MKLTLTFLFAMFFWQAGYAADNMIFHGTLVAPPCYISENKIIEVPFGNRLAIKKIDGVNFMVPVVYQIHCDDSYTAGRVAIVIDTSNPTTFDSAAVKTDKTGLGIRILVNNEPVTFGERIAVDDVASPPQVQAVPVKDPAVTLTEGAFDATLTLRTDYL
ncbi:fimbrial protein [Siccibacter turicensis]|uniref:fimbrial protein n=1 Tax=Siccibacter turicensis TaxID=357233 RepID=UPI003F558CB7